MTDYTPNEPIECGSTYFFGEWMCADDLSPVDSVVTYHDRDLALVRVNDVWYEA